MNWAWAQFAIEVNNTNTHPSPLGMDNVTFIQCSTNPGQPMQPSSSGVGGELSRISLAIGDRCTKVRHQVWFFDEVDVAVSGPTAAVVGKMLH